LLVTPFDEFDRSLDLQKTPETGRTWDHFSRGKSNRKLGKNLRVTKFKLKSTQKSGRKKPQFLTSLQETHNAITINDLNRKNVHRGTKALTTRRGSKEYLQTPRKFIHRKNKTLLLSKNKDEATSLIK
jgi:hypothetical protein